MVSLLGILTQQRPHLGIERCERGRGWCTFVLRWQVRGSRPLDGSLADPQIPPPAVAKLRPRPVTGSTPNPPLISPIQSVRAASFSSVAGSSLETSQHVANQPRLLHNWKMVSQGIVRSWDIDQMHGVIESEDTPGGSYTPFPAVLLPGFPALTAGQHVYFEWSHREAPLFGFRYETSRVWLAETKMELESAPRSPFRARLWRLNSNGAADEIEP